jgi:hypothetical protein
MRKLAAADPGNAGWQSRSRPQPAEVSAASAPLRARAALQEALAILDGRSVCATCSRCCRPNKPMPSDAATKMLALDRAGCDGTSSVLSRPHSGPRIEGPVVILRRRRAPGGFEVANRLANVDPGPVARPQVEVNVRLGDPVLAQNLKISVAAIGGWTGWSGKMQPKRLDAHSDGADHQLPGRQ